MSRYVSRVVVDAEGVPLAYAIGQIFDISDTGNSNALPISDVGGTGFPLDQLVANGDGVTPEFNTPAHPQVKWVSGTFQVDMVAWDTIPEGGATNQVLAKNSSDDYDLGWISQSGIPTGGTDGQVLTKNGSTNYVTQWETPSAGGSVSAGDVDTIVGDLVNGGTGASVGALDGRYKKLGIVPIADLPAGSTIVVRKTGSSWPARPTSRTDIIVIWVGLDPDPTIITSGTSGAINNVDVRMAF